MIKDRVFKGKVKQVANFHLKNVYEFIYDHLSDEGWTIHENIFRQKTLGENLREGTIDWTVSKRISDYFKYEISIIWILLAVKDVKVMADGQETKMQNGTLELNFDVFLVKDHNNKWDKGLAKSMREIYDNYIIRSRIEDYEVDLNEKVNEILAVIKSFLAIEGQHQY